MEGGHRDQGATTVGTRQLQNEEHMKFGVFNPPLHDAAENLTLAIKRDVELAVHLDRLGYDSIWFGEHHSLGFETIPEPELMIAAAAMLTKRIKLATGVVSLPYHHPLIVADRMCFLDHLTEGRLIMGVGPGALVTDAEMLGMDYNEQRRKMAESLKAITAMLRMDEPVTMETDWFKLKDASLHLHPYQEPRFPIYVAATQSPAGPRIAGEHGFGMISMTASSPSGFEALANTWSTAEEQAQRFGQQVNRDNWNICAYCHIADTEEQARRNVAYGIRQWVDYYGRVSYLTIDTPSDDIDSIVDYMNDTGIACIGTADRMVEWLKRFQSQTGGFGTFLSFGHDWANREATNYSYELMARRVFPFFDGSNRGPQKGFELAGQRNREWYVSRLNAGWQRAREDFDREANTKP
jgi:limonene 1,2-monooxygenase